MKRAQNLAILCPLFYLVYVGEHCKINMCPNGTGTPVGEQYGSGILSSQGIEGKVFSAP